MATRLAILCPGLGHVFRGFEVAANNWFNELRLRGTPSVDLLTGGSWAGSRRVRNLRRDGKAARLLRELRLIGDGCRLEQITFAFGLLPFLFRQQPEIIWIQEGTLGQVLIRFRRWFKFRYKIVFCDGAPLGAEFADKFDYIIFLHSYALQAALALGVDARKCALIPYIATSPSHKLERAAARTWLGIEPSKFVIICVAAWNKHHKRIDYLLQEVAVLGHPDITLLLCGQEENESGELKLLAERLGVDAHWHTLEQEELSSAYVASDLFVLPSLNEGLGLVLIEAGLHGLPIICHPHAASLFVLGEEYPGLADLSGKGTLATKITEFRTSGDLEKIGRKVRTRIEKEFDRNKLVREFVGLIEQIPK